MVCPRCGNNVSEGEASCPNCGADLDRQSRDLDSGGDHLREMSQKLQAVTSTARLISEGEVLADRFEVGEFVGEGPFGQVYRATDDLTETTVALKILESELLETPPQEQDFLDATAAARKMTQRNVVRVHDSGISDGHPWVSMQYLEGLSLRKTLDMRERKGERFGLEEAEPVVSQVTMALQHIGRESPVGDLKPSNIFFLPDLVKVTDGYLLAALPPDVFSERLQESRYLAPELRETAATADARSDVYSLGTILGEMFFGPDYTPGTTEFADETEKALDRLCRRATAESPDERYDNLETLSEDYSTLVDTGQLLERPGTGAAGSVNTAVPEPPAEPAAGVPSDEMATREYDRGDSSPASEPAPPPESPGQRDAQPSPSSEDATEAEPASPRPETSGRGRETSRRAGVAPHRIALVGLALVAAVGVIAALFTGWGASLLRGLTGGAETDDQKVVSIPGGSDGTDRSEKPRPPSAEVKSAFRAARGSVDSAVGSARQAASNASDKRARGGPDAGRASEKMLAANQTQEEASDPGAVSDDKEETPGGGEKQGGAAGSRSGADETEAAGTPESEPEGAGGGAKDGTCPGGMVKVGSDSPYCIDRYEYPGAGSKPMTNTTWFEAKKACEDQGKRLCTLREWRRACGSKYPWGGSWDASKCNTADEAGFGRSLRPTGEQRSCRSYSGAYDMVGNAFEWTKEKKIAGGGFRSGPETASCRYSSPKEPGSSSPAIGFRCCADVN